MTKSPIRRTLRIWKAATFASH